jgi:sugar lactone lactonase YvrE
VPAPKRKAITPRRRQGELPAPVAGSPAAQSPHAEDPKSPSPPAIGTVTIFATVPTPGHPFGVLATPKAVYAATSAGSPFTIPNTAGEAVFRYPPEGGTPEATVRVQTMPTMGLSGIAEDGQGRIYVVDMNGRILRFTPTATGLDGPVVYAAVPEPYATLGWQTSMWTNLAFDAHGNLYVPDASQGAIWIIPPGAPGATQPRIWLQCTQFLSLSAVGLNGIAFGPDHKTMYVVLDATPVPDQQPAAPFGESIIYRLQTASAQPNCTQLETFHEFPFDPTVHPPAGTIASNPTPWPVANSLAFADSGHLYVTLSSADRIIELDSAGNVIHTITNSAFDIPLGVSFRGNTLLVADSNTFPPPDQDAWKLLSVYVGEPGLPPLQPDIPA